MGATVSLRSPLQPRRRGHVLDRLLHAEIRHNFFGAAQNRRKLGRFLEPFDDLSHPRFGDGAASEDLARLVHDKLANTRALKLEERDWARELKRLLLVVHLVHLVRDVLEPVLERLDLRRHVRELVADDGLRDERLAKDDALVRPLIALLQHEPRPADGTDDNHPALVIEVAHDALEAFVLLAEEVAHGNLDIVVLDVRGARGRAVARLDLLRGQPLRALNEEQGDAAHPRAASAHGCDEVVRKRAVRDPLFDAVDDVELPARRLGSRAADVGDVAPGEGLRDCKADALVAGVHLGDHLALDRGGRKVNHARQPDDEPGAEAVRVPRHAETRHLLVNNHLVEKVEFLRSDTADEAHAFEVRAGAHARREQARAAELLVNLERRILSRVVVRHSRRHNLAVHKLAHSAAEALVGLGEVRRLKVVPIRALGVRHPAQLAVDPLRLRRGRGARQLANHEPSTRLAENFRTVQ
mmetsp:Transcript_29302/g.95497  ORF Transcript_29302/g.95497 Transcript_29302/m.95497 type:complete len:469 (+) Transcript_29302:1331-2737(+)